MTKQRVIQYIEESINDWNNITEEQLKEIDNIIEFFSKDGLDYENICYFLLYKLTK